LISIPPDWNILTRTILPVMSMPSHGPGVDSKNGIGDTTFTAFLSPANPGHWIWGAGPVVQMKEKKAIKEQKKQASVAVPFIKH